MMDKIKIAHLVFIIVNSMLILENMTRIFEVNESLLPLVVLIIMSTFVILFSWYSIITWHQPKRGKS